MNPKCATIGTVQQKFSSVPQTEIIHALRFKFGGQIKR
jgi:hypothetical protein